MSTTSSLVNTHLNPNSLTCFIWCYRLSRFRRHQLIFSTCYVLSCKISESIYLVDTILVVLLLFANICTPKWILQSTKIATFWFGFFFSQYFILTKNYYNLNEIWKCTRKVWGYEYQVEFLKYTTHRQLVATTTLKQLAFVISVAIGFPNIIIYI